MTGGIPDAIAAVREIWHVPRVAAPPQVRARAVRTVAAHARDPAELLHLLAMLDLTCDEGATDG